MKSYTIISGGSEDTASSTSTVMGSKQSSVDRRFSHSSMGTLHQAVAARRGRQTLSDLI